MARRRAPERPSGDGTGLVMPAEIVIYRPGEWSSSRDHDAAQREWLRGHGIDPGDWSAVHPILVRSKRAHAVLVRDLPAQDRARRRAEGAGPNDPAQPQH